MAASIVSRAVGGCVAPVTDAGYNISADASCGFSATAHSQPNTPIAAQLGQLGPHGGPTDTVPLSAATDDPANDVIPASFAPYGTSICAGADQRGVARSTPCDVGAVESPVVGADLFAYPTGAGGQSGSCPRTTDVTQRCTLTTALSLAGAGSTIWLAQSGSLLDPSSWYVGNYLVNVPGIASYVLSTTCARPARIFESAQ